MIKQTLQFSLLLIGPLFHSGQAWGQQAIPEFEKMVDESPSVPLNTRQAEQVLQAHSSGPQAHTELFSDISQRWHALMGSGVKTSPKRSFEAALSHHDSELIAELEAFVRPKFSIQDMRKSARARTNQWQPSFPAYFRKTEDCEEPRRSSLELLWQNHWAEQLQAADEWLSNIVAKEFLQSQQDSRVLAQFLEAKKPHVLAADHTQVWLRYNALVRDLARIQWMRLNDLRGVYEHAAFARSTSTPKARCDALQSSSIKQQKRQESTNASEHELAALDGDVGGEQLFAALIELWPQIVAKHLDADQRFVFLDNANAACVTLMPAYGIAEYSKQKELDHWYIDLPDDLGGNRRGEILRQQLNVLVDSGFLERRKAVLETKHRSFLRFRHTLSEEGKKISTSSGDGYCFNYGKPVPLELKEFKKIEGASKRGRLVYQVAGIWGFNDLSELEAWARSSEARRAFGIINDQLKANRVNLRIAHEKEIGWYVH